MSKFVSIFFLTLLICIVFFYALLNVFDGGDHVESAVYTFGTIILILQAFVIALLYYLIDSVKKKH
ncbi:hypothetical protein [Bacillus timonensis]|uniref:hypothetical protein n=1 Tax=Bacillus timonensis TaxID=1033734 RepID=UPI00028945FB|nr:hypothetical protein [Bacillus timonensis]